MNKINIIDIGAFGGLGSISPWKRHLNKVGSILSFEPNEDPLFSGDKLKYNCAVWNFDGVAEFHVYGENGVGSSLLTQNFKWVEENFENIKSEGNQKLNLSWFDRSTETDTLQLQAPILE
jgi:hypothetical protein